MGLHISLDKYARLRRSIADERPSDAPPSWQFLWPNTADFNFNYYRLLAEAKDTGIGRNS